MQKLLVAAGIALFALAACGEDHSGHRKDGFSETAKTPEDSLFQKVMDGHDEAMAKMGKLSGYRKQVESRIDSLKQVKSSAKADLSRQYEELKEKLKLAEDGMNQWMHEFSIDSAQDDIDRRMEYLRSEQVKVEKVKEDIFSVLQRADSALRK